MRIDWTTALVALAVAVAGAAAAIAWLSYRRESAALATRRVSVPPLPDDRRIDGLTDVAFAAPDGASVRGWYRPSRNRAAVILTHGSGATRAQVVPQARILAARGFGVLLFDWPGHGESSGVVSWGGAPAGALSAAVAFVAARPDVDDRRIAAFGFSMGGYFLARFAPNESRIAAIAIEGVPASAEEQTRFEYRRFGPLSQLPALYALRQVGWRPGDERACDALPRFAPRPLLIVAGAADPAVPLSMARQLFDAAREPKELWVIEGAHHGDGRLVARGEYEPRLGGFFERSLLASAAREPAASLDVAVSAKRP